MISVRPDPVRYIDQLDADTGPADDADKVQVQTLKRPGPAPQLSFMFRVPAAEIFKLSLSPFFDDIAVFHVRAVRRITVTIPDSDNTMQYFSVIANTRTQESAKHSRLSLLGSCQEEGRFCLSDRPRHRDRDQAVPRGAERHGQTSCCQYQHSVRCQLWNSFSHFSIQGTERFHEMERKNFCG